MGHCRARETAAHDKAAASEAELREEELQANSAKLQKQLDKVGAPAFDKSPKAPWKQWLLHIQPACNVCFKHVAMPHAVNAAFPGKQASYAVRWYAQIEHALLQICTCSGRFKQQALCANAWRTTGGYTPVYANQYSYAVSSAGHVLLFKQCTATS